MLVCEYVCMCVYMYTYVCMWMRMYKVCVHVLCVWMCTCLFVCACVHICVCVQTQRSEDNLG